MQALLQVRPSRARVALDSARSRLDEAEPHVPRMVAVARSILGCHDLAWDAVQESLMRLWHESSRPDDLGRWLVRTVVHRSLHQARTRRRRRWHEQSAFLEGNGSSLESDPRAELDEREFALVIERALRALPDEFRETFRLRAIDGRPYGEIAAHLGVPVGTVRSRLHRAKALLRIALADLVHEPARCRICSW